MKKVVIALTILISLGIAYYFFIWSWDSKVSIPLGHFEEPKKQLNNNNENIGEKITYIQVPGGDTLTLNNTFQNGLLFLSGDSENYFENWEKYKKTILVPFYTQNNLLPSIKELYLLLDQSDLWINPASAQVRGTGMGIQDWGRLLSTTTLYYCSNKEFAKANVYMSINYRMGYNILRYNKDAINSLIGSVVTKNALNSIKICNVKFQLPQEDKLNILKTLKQYSIGKMSTDPKEMFKKEYLSLKENIEKKGIKTDEKSEKLLHEIAVYYYQLSIGANAKEIAKDYTLYGTLGINLNSLQKKIISFMRENNMDDKPIGIMRDIDVLMKVPNVIVRPSAINGVNSKLESLIRSYDETINILTSK